MIKEMVVGFYLLEFDARMLGVNFESTCTV